MKAKKILILITMFFVLAFTIANANALSGTCGDDATYCLNNNILTISGRGIVDDDSGWMDYCDIVDTLIINEGIEELDSRLFDGFEMLVSVKFPNTLTTIGARCFRNCSSLEKIIIPDSVENINNNSFSGCDDLVIYCSANSYAETYAIANSIEYKIIGNITISFNSNGGIASPEALIGSMVEEFEIPVKTPRRNGYAFVGWADVNNATEGKYKSGDIVHFDESVTLYAVWLKCYFKVSES